MATHTDCICDLTGEVARLSDFPVVVRLQVFVPPGALVDPRRAQIAAVSPFLERMLFTPDGQARTGLLELSGRAFANLFTVELDRLAPAFAGPPEADQIAQLRATLEAREDEVRRLRAEKHDLEHERTVLRRQVEGPPGR